MKQEAAHLAPPEGRQSRVPLIVLIVLAVLVAAYLGFCAWVQQSDTFWRGAVILGQDVTGQTQQEAMDTINAALPEMKVAVRLYPQGAEEEIDPAAELDASIPLSALGVTVDTEALVSEAHRSITSGSFLSAGIRYFSKHGAVSFGAGERTVTVDAQKALDAAQQTADALSREPRGTEYEIGENCINVTLAKDGRTVSLSDLRQGLETAAWAGDLKLFVPYTTETAQVLSAQEIHDAVAGEMKNAGYDPATKSITPEQLGAEFDVTEAQGLLDAAQPGETVTIPADIQRPAVTAEQLKDVLFRDVLGTCKTHVSGTAARISNVKLSASTINGYVLNCGEVFSYNGAVGQRTAARGYQPAPAYVKGETVDEIGGGICQTSSTLYLACLRSNLEIVQRYAHRYAPSYIAWGLDATVSWGGPDYQFRNDTNYPIRIETRYSGGYLTVNLYGTKTDDVTVKITTEKLSDTPYETIYEEDPTLAPGTEQVKTTPYTGHKVRSYRNLYDGNGNLISSTLEAVSDYKSRNKVILRGPALPTGGDGGITDPGGETEPIEPAAPELGSPENPIPVPDPVEPPLAG